MANRLALNQLALFADIIEPNLENMALLSALSLLAFAFGCAAFYLFVATIIYWGCKKNTEPFFPDRVKKRIAVMIFLSILSVGAFVWSRRFTLY